MSERQKGFKGAVSATSRRKVTVAGYRFGTQPLVEMRVLRNHRDQGEGVDLTLPQAREMVRLLLDAIESAYQLARHDGTPALESGDRASPGEASRNVRQTAQA